MYTSPFYDACTFANQAKLSESLGLRQIQFLDPAQSKIPELNNSYGNRVVSATKTGCLQGANIQIENELKGLDTRLTYDGPGAYVKSIPTTSCSPRYAPTPDQFALENSRTTNSAKNLKGRGYNRFDYLHYDPQFLPHVLARPHGINTSLMMKDNHHPCFPEIPKKLPQKPVTRSPMNDFPMPPEVLPLLEIPGTILHTTRCR